MIIITNNLSNDMYPIIFNEFYWDYDWADIDFVNVFLLFEGDHTLILHRYLNTEEYASKILNKMFRRLK